MYSVNLKKTEQHAARVPALHERIYPTKFDSAELVAGCGSVFCCLFYIDKAQRHQYWTFDVERSMFDVQSVNFSGQAELHTRFSPAAEHLKSNSHLLY
jgi:hypothetical protein